jgi:thiamine-phosphate diphosphorylase
MVALPAPTPAIPPLVPVVHAVTTRAILARPDFLAVARRVMQTLGARGAVHVRLERTTPAEAHAPSTRALAAMVESLVDAQAMTGAWLVINDRLDIALAIGAAGVQLTSHSLVPEDALHAARAAGVTIAVGASVHGVEEARAAAPWVTWVVAGHVYGTPSHTGSPGRGLGAVRAIAAACVCPVIAIGGITPAEVPALRAAGAHGIAAVRGIWLADDAAAACNRYLFAYDGSGERERTSRDAHRQR